MTVLDGLPPSDLWEWFFRNLADLGFQFDHGFGAWRGTFRGRDFYIFVSEPFVARFPDHVEDLCEILARMDRTTPEKIRKQIAVAYQRAGGEIPQGASFTDDGRKYSRIAARQREKYGIKD